MYFWNVDKLVDDFRNDRVTEDEKYKYFLIMVIVSVSLSGLPNKSVDYSNIIFQLFVSYWGVRRCYKINQNVDGKDFISRFVCLGLPCTIRFLIFIVVVYIGLPTILNIADIAFSGNYLFKLFTAFSYIALSIAYYFYIGSYFEDLGETNIELNEVEIESYNSGKDE